MHVMTVEHHHKLQLAARHCPKCQGNKREDWIQERHRTLASAILPRGFTLPDSINSLAIHQPKLVLRYALKRHGNTKTFGKAKEMQME
jgi:hypothetical protein